MRRLAHGRRGPGVVVAITLAAPLLALGPARASALASEDPVEAVAGPVTNGMVATFAWNPGAHSSEELDLVVMNPDGSGAQVLVADAAERSGCGFDLEWSPDGNRIAWASGGQVRTVKADGTDVRHLADGCVSELDWSPDGSTLAVEMNERVGLLTVGTGAFRWLRSCLYGEFDPSFSPDGSTIATVATQDCDTDPIGWGIYGFDVADGALDARYADTNLRGQPPNAGWDAVPDTADWHPSQDLLLTQMDDAWSGGSCHPLGQEGQWTNSDLLTVPPSADGVLTRIGSTSGEFALSERDASWSPDGQRILFTGSRNLSCQNSSYVQSGVELYTMNANGTGTTKIWTPWDPQLGFVHSSWQPCTPATTSCTPPPDSDGDGVPDAKDACPGTPGPASNGGCPEPPADSDGDGVPDASDACPTTPGPAGNGGCPVTTPPPGAGDKDGDGVPDESDACPTVKGPASNQGCPLAPGPGPVGECVGLSRAAVLGDYLAGEQLSPFPNRDTMCAGLMLAGAEQGFVPQGLALGGGSAWVTGYVPGGGCWVMRVELATAKVLQGQKGIRAKKVPACQQAGGAVLNKHGLWVVDKHGLWLLDPSRVGKAGAVKDHWSLYRGTDAARRLKGSFLLDSGGRLGIGQHGKKADKILMFRIAKLRKASTRTLVASGPAGPGEAAPNGVVQARKRAQGATLRPGGGLYISASKATCGLLAAPGSAPVGFGPGAEEFEFSGSGRIWAVFQASAQKNHSKSGLVVPMLGLFDAAKLFATGAEPAAC